MCTFGHLGLLGAEYLQSLMGFGNVHKWEEEKEGPEGTSSLLPSSSGDQRQYRWPLAHWRGTEEIERLKDSLSFSFSVD